jgi:hypothetical protein
MRLIGIAVVVAVNLFVASLAEAQQVKIRVLYAGFGCPPTGGNVGSSWRLFTAALIDRIINGARPEDLPVEEPTSYELVIDGVMAKALGLTIPPSVRARADEILE